MGRVKLDIHRGEYEFKHVTLSNVDSVLGLILFRSKLDKYYAYEQRESMLTPAGYKDVNQELLALYADLDVLVKACDLSKGDAVLLHALEMGYTYKDISEYVSEDVRRIKTKARDIARRVAEENNRQWLAWAYLNYIATEWKTCRLCGNSYPMNDKFFWADANNKTGYRNECIKCLKKPSRTDFCKKA